jgi:hypothetical protein
LEERKSLLFSLKKKLKHNPDGTDFGLCRFAQESTGKNRFFVQRIENDSGVLTKLLFSVYTLAV